MIQRDDMTFPFEEYQRRLNELQIVVGNSEGWN